MQAGTALLQNLLDMVPIEPGGKVGTAGTASPFMKDACGSGIGEKSFLSTLLGVAGNQNVCSSENMSLLESLETASLEESIGLKGIIEFLKQNNISIAGEKGQLNSIIESLIVGLKDPGNNDNSGNSEQKLEGEFFNDAEGNVKKEYEILRLLSLVTGDGTDPDNAEKINKLNSLVTGFGTESDNAEKIAKLNSLLNEEGFFKDLKLPSELALKESQGGHNNPGSEILKTSTLPKIFQSDGPLSEGNVQRSIPFEKENSIINSELSKNNREDGSQKPVAEIQKDSSLFKLNRTETPLQEKTIQANTSLVKEDSGKDSTQAKVIQMNTSIEKQEIHIDKDTSLRSESGFKESAEGKKNTEKNILENTDAVKKESSDSVAINKGRNPIDKITVNTKLSSDVDDKASSTHSNLNVDKSAEEDAKSACETTSTRLDKNPEVKISEKTIEDNLKNQVLLKSDKSNSGTENQPRVSETTNKDLNALNKEISRLQDGKTSDSEKGETSRFNIIPNKEMPTISTNADSWQRYMNINDPAQKSQMLGENINISKVVKVDSGSGEESTLSSNNQSAGKNQESVAQTKETQHFQKTFQPAVMKQVVEKAMLNLKNGQSSIRISLKPEALGQLKMQITTENNQVMVKILTEVPIVKDIIEGNLSQLKADFQNQGLEIEKFDVSVDHGSTQHKAFSGRLPFPGAISGTGDESNEDGLLNDTEEKGMHADTRKSSGLVNFFA